MKRRKNNSEYFSKIPTFCVHIVLHSILYLSHKIHESVIYLFEAVHRKWLSTSVSVEYFILFDNCITFFWEMKDSCKSRHDKHWNQRLNGAFFFLNLKSAKCNILMILRESREIIHFYFTFYTFLPSFADFHRSQLEILYSESSFKANCVNNCRKGIDHHN